MMPKPFELGGVTINPGKAGGPFDLSVAPPLYSWGSGHPGPCSSRTAGWSLASSFPQPFTGDEINGVENYPPFIEVKKYSAICAAPWWAIPIVNVFWVHWAIAAIYQTGAISIEPFPAKKNGSPCLPIGKSIDDPNNIEMRTMGSTFTPDQNHRSNFSPDFGPISRMPKPKRLASVFRRHPSFSIPNCGDGSLRQALVEKEVPVLLYEAGEAMRFDESLHPNWPAWASSMSMRYLKMLTHNPQKKPPLSCPSSALPVLGYGAPLQRAYCVSLVKPGQHIQKDQKMGPPFPILSVQNENHRHGKQLMGVCHWSSGDAAGFIEGDALYHLAQLRRQAPYPIPILRDYLSQWENETCPRFLDTANQK